MITLIKLKCVVCGKLYSIAVDLNHYYAWKYNKVPIEEALPELSNDLRYMIAHKVCSKCHAGILK